MCVYIVVEGIPRPLRMELHSLNNSVPSLTPLSSDSHYSILCKMRILLVEPYSVFLSMTLSIFLATVLHIHHDSM
jgi:hypothetical protein